MLRPVRYHGSPRPLTPRPQPSPFGVLEMVDELRKMYSAFTAGLQELKAIHATWKEVKKGEPGLPGKPGTPGENGKNVTSAMVDDAVRRMLIQPKDGVAPSAESVADELAQNPRFAKMIKQTLRELETQEEQTEDEGSERDSIVAEVLAKFAGTKIGMHMIDGLDQKIAEVRNHVARSSTMRGGGDTVVAGTGVVIENTPNGNKKINVTGGVGAWQTPPESPDGSIVDFTVGSTAPTDVVADGNSFYEGAGYAFSGGTITFDNPPAQYVRYR